MSFCAVNSSASRIFGFSSSEYVPLGWKSFMSCASDMCPPSRSLQPSAPATSRHGKTTPFGSQQANASEIRAKIHLNFGCRSGKGSISWRKQFWATESQWSSKTSKYIRQVICTTCWHTLAQVTQSCSWFGKSMPIMPRSAIPHAPTYIGRNNSCLARYAKMQNRVEYNAKTTSSAVEST